MSKHSKKWGIPWGTHAIYQIRNTKNGKIYIGSAVNVANRFSKHLMDLRKGVSGCSRLQSAWKHHGEKFFEFQIVEYVEEKEKLVAREQFYFDFFKPEYNILKFARSALGFKASKESREKMSKARTGKKIPALQGENHPNYGVPMRPEIKRRLSIMRSGENNPMHGVTPKHAKLSRDQVIDIKVMISSGSTTRQIMEKYPFLSYLNVSQIRCGRAYKRINP